jgi:cation:H+ antiporter
LEYLIPQDSFDGLHWLWLLLLVGGAMLFLIKGADWLVEGASGSAYRLGISKVIVGATIVSLGTTSPEAAVSVMAAWQGEPGLALGNAVGSIIADTGLIFGLGCLLAVLPADRFVLSRQGWVQLGSAVLLAAICYLTWARQGDAATIDRWVGVLFLGLLGAYLAVSVRWSRQHTRAQPFMIDDAAAIDRKAHESLWKLGLFMLVGLVLVVFASRVLICAVTALAEQWGVPKVVIAGTLVALGTSLPELVVGMTAILKGHKELLVGNVIGADILNVLFVVGGSAVAKPLPLIEPHAAVPQIFLYLHLPTMLVVLLLFRVFIFRAAGKGHFSRWYGVPLLAIYVGFVLVGVITSR